MHAYCHGLKRARGQRGNKRHLNHIFYHN
jgi:hypothetical protein